MNILVSGATGFIGSALASVLMQGGHAVTALTRSKGAPGARTISWDPERGMLDAGALEGIDAVVHLAGESIVGRWTPQKKQRIRNSRVQGTTLLVQRVARMSKPPRAFVCASAMGFYGDRGDELLDERSAAGTGFLAEVCQAWEAATASAKQRDIRTVSLRFGIVLSSRGGALAKMLPPFRLGLGGPLGSGRQWWSWITLDDVVGAIQHALVTESLAGPVNVTAPAPATNAEFTKALGRALRRPTIFPVPRLAAQLLMGEMADALLFASARVIPRQLEATSYHFLYPDLDRALRHLLARS